ncbi:MAG: phospholipase [Porphyromonadaceae bacterium]|nr:phospholipase [Porphyromonadaceae bacterium]
MLSLILLLILVGLIVFVATYFNRKGKNEPVEVVVNEDPLCCGAHEICEIDNLQIVDAKIEYFDDEELDVLAGISPENYTKNQVDSISEVFYSMNESDVSGWLRSLQLRNIRLPDFIREEALMIVAERREEMGTLVYSSEF